MRKYNQLFFVLKLIYLKFLFIKLITVQSNIVDKSSSPNNDWVFSHAMNARIILLIRIDKIFNVINGWVYK